MVTGSFSSRSLRKHGAKNWNTDLVWEKMPLKSSTVQELHEDALIKQKWMGIKGKTLQWLLLYLAQRKIVVVIGGKSAQSQDFTAGASRDNVLGSNTFCCFINDLPSILWSDVGLLIHGLSSILFTILQPMKHFLQQDWDDIWAWAHGQVINVPVNVHHQQ